MDSNKYFVPQIEDIRVGYECEIQPNKGYEDTWIPTIGKCEEIPGNGVKSCNLDELTYDCLIDGYIGIRVPYLTKEQIEAEGWKEYPYMTYCEETRFFKGLETAHYNFKTRQLTVDDEKGDVDDILFKGTCKCINDFRLIMKLLCMQ